MGEMRNTYKILVGKAQGKRPLRRPRRRFEDNIKIYLTEIGWEVVDSIHRSGSGLGTVEGSCEHEPSDTTRGGKYSE
jgi:hypothetical protein